MLGELTTGLRDHARNETFRDYNSMPPDDHIENRYYTSHGWLPSQLGIYALDSNTTCNRPSAFSPYPHPQRLLSVCMCVCVCVNYIAYTVRAKGVPPGLAKALMTMYLSTQGWNIVVKTSLMNLTSLHMRISWTWWHWICRSRGCESDKLSPGEEPAQKHSKVSFCLICTCKWIETWLLRMWGSMISFWWTVICPLWMGGRYVMCVCAFVWICLYGVESVEGKCVWVYAD